MRNPVVSNDQPPSLTAVRTIILAAGIAFAATTSASGEVLVDPASKETMAQVGSELARLQQEIHSLREIQNDTSAELNHIRAGLANATIGLESMRSSIDESEQSQRQSTTELGRRIGRLESLIASGERTGSISTPSASHRNRQVLADWSVQDVQNGQVVIADHGETFLVTPGTVIPRLGRVTDVHQRANRWIVVTEKGIIVQR